MAENWFDFLPGRLDRGADGGTALETSDSFDTFLTLFFESQFKTFTSADKYNYYDLNRVENNCKYLAKQLNSYGYAVSVTVKTDWTMYNFPTLAHFSRIRTNIIALISAFAKMGGSPDMDFTTRFIWDDANDFETNLKNLNTLLELMIASFWYGGEIYGGEQ